MNKRLFVSVLIWLFVFSFGAVSQEEFGAVSQKERRMKDGILIKEDKAGDIIYVDSATGDDDKGNGTEKKPFKTITKALSVAYSEDTIKVGPGTYNESLYIRIDRLFIEGSGSDNTVINGDTSSEHTIDAAYNDFLYISGCTISGGLWNAIRFFSVHRGIVVDCVIRDSGGKGIFVTYNSSAWIYNCEIRNNLLSGVRSHASSNAYLFNCIISENASEGGFGARATDNASLGLYDCEVKNHSVWGIAIGHNSHLYMSGCSVHHNQIGLFVTTGGVADLFHVGEDERNQIYENTERGITVSHGAAAQIENADIVNNNEIGVEATYAGLLWLHSGIEIRGHEIGVEVNAFGTAFVQDVLVTGNTVGVRVIEGGQAQCDPDTITGNGTDINSECKYCQK